MRGSVPGTTVILEPTPTCGQCHAATLVGQTEEAQVEADKRAADTASLTGQGRARQQDGYVALCDGIRRRGTSEHPQGSIGQV